MLFIAGIIEHAASAGTGAALDALVSARRSARAAECVTTVLGNAVVAHAAIQMHGRDKPLHEIDDDAWDQTHAVNLRGAFLSCRAALRQKARGDQAVAAVGPAAAADDYFRLRKRQALIEEKRRACRGDGCRRGCPRRGWPVGRNRRDL